MAKVFLFRPKWYMGKDIEPVIEKLLIGRSLNMPCGQSRFGDVRADIFPDMKPHVIADILNPMKTFKPLEFDSVFCDPPFNFYTDNRIGLRWIYKMSELAKKRIIFKTPKFQIKLKRSIWKKHYIIVEDNRMSFSFLQVFDRINKTLLEE